MNLKSKNNDKVSSLRVVKGPSAVGYWQGITSTETQEYSFHVGINYERSEGSSSQVQESITVGMKAGFSFMGASGSVSVEASVSRSLTHDVQSTYGVDYGIANHTTCTTKDKEGAGLYQWIVSTDDMRNQAFTWHTVCRTGALWNKAPECPFFSCLNADCSECESDWSRP